MNNAYFLFFFFSVNKAKVIKRQSVFDRLGKEPVELVAPPEGKKTEIKTLKPLKTSVTVQLKVKTEDFIVIAEGLVIV